MDDKKKARMANHQPAMPVPAPISDNRAQNNETNETNETEWLEPIHIIEPVSTDDILNIKEPEYLIDKTITRNSQTLFYAKPKTGKSLVTLNMCVCLATGMPFLNCETHLERNIAYLNLDMDRQSFLARIKPVIKGMHPKASENELASFIEQVNDRVKIIDNLSLRNSGAKRPNFFKYENLKDLEFFLIHHNCELLIIDTMAKVRAGSKENDNDDMGVTLDNIRQFTENINCGTIAIHHAGKDGGFRGASAISQEVDLIMGLERSQNSHKKLKLFSDDARIGSPFNYEVYPIFQEDEETETLLSYVLSLTPSDADTKHIKEYLLANGNLYTSARTISSEAFGGYNDNQKLIATMYNKGELERIPAKPRGFLYRLKTDNQQ